MRRLMMMIVLQAIFAGQYFAQEPAGYYNAAQGLYGAELRAALHGIIDNHVEYSYTDLITLLKATDEDPNNSNNVILLYTGRSQAKTTFGGDPNDWNREHVWAKSHGDFGESKPCGTDLHHMRPTDASVNSSRGNLDFDNGGSPHSEATECNYDSNSWEVRDAAKGDVARMMLYMIVRYEGTAGELDLELVDYVNTDGTPTFGKFSTLLAWHQQDPVDSFEQTRNNVIHQYQQNRNPFVDYPELVDLIWGGNSQNSYSVSCGESAQLDIYGFFPYSGISYSWSPTDGLSNPNISNPTASPSNTTNYQVTMNFQGGYTVTETIPVTVQGGNLNVNISATQEALICGESKVLQVVSGYDYEWSPNLFISSTGVYNPTVTPDQTTTYYVTVSAGNCPPGYDSITVEVQPLEIQNHTGGDSLMCGETAGISYSLNSNNGSYVYEWTPSTGVSNSSASHPDFSPGVSTDYELSISHGQCNVGLTHSITVVPADYNVNFEASGTIFIAPPFDVSFQNNTPNPGDYQFTWYFGDGTYQVTSNAVVSHTYAANGTYTVTLIAETAYGLCSDTLIKQSHIDCSGGVSCTHNATINQSGTITICENDSTLLNCNTDTGFTYQWNLNGTPIIGAESNEYYASEAGFYSVTVFENSCPVTSAEINITNYNSIAPVINTFSSSGGCQGDSIGLITTEQFFSYLWSTGETSSVIYVQNSGNYNITVTDLYGCNIVSDDFAVNMATGEAPSICILSIDTATNTNYLVWEKEATDAIESYNIYKESTDGQYTILDNVPYNQLSLYTDIYTDAGLESKRYKISVIDTCGTETPLSEAHRTIHLDVSKDSSYGFVLAWNQYEGIDPYSYNIYWGTSQDNMSLLTQVGTSTSTYTDNPGTALVYYCLEISMLGSCNPSKAYTKSRSNVVYTDFSGVDEVSKEEYEVYIYPNPNQGSFTIQLDKETKGTTKAIIYDINSRVIKEFDIIGNNAKTDLTDINKGFYFIKLQNQSFCTTKAVIVE